MKEMRNFHVSDARFLEHAEVIAASLPADMPDFSAFDATLTGDYVTQIQDTISKAKDVLPDNVVIDELAEKTQLVEKALDACYNDYKTLSYFIKKAFKSDPAVRNQFGLNDIEKARRSQPKMVVFMETLAKTAATYTDELTTAGCPADLIPGMADKATALQNANVEQEKFKNKRNYDTQNRIQLLNNLYELLRPLYDAAAIVYAGDPQKRNLYKPPKRTKKRQTTSDNSDTSATSNS